MPVTAYFDFGFLGFSSMPRIRPLAISGQPNLSGSGTSFKIMWAPRSCFSKVCFEALMLFSMMLSPRTTQIFSPLDKGFSQTKSISDAALAFLIRIVNAMQIKILAVGHQSQEIARILPSGNDDDVSDAEGLDRIEHHRPVIDRQEMLVSHPRERVKSRPLASSQNDTFH